MSSWPPLIYLGLTILGLGFAIATDVRPALREWRRAHGLPDDPLAAFRESGYLARVTAERASRAHQPAGSPLGSGY